MDYICAQLNTLWSSPAKAAQEESGQWSTNEVFISVFIAGVVLALVSELSLLNAFNLRRISFQNTKRLAFYLVEGKYLEATILFAFGLSSLWNGLSYWIGLMHCVSVY